MQRAVLAGLMLLACCAPAFAQESLPPPPPLSADPADDVAAKPPVPDEGVPDEAAPEAAAEANDDELPPWNPGVPLWSGAGCLIGGLLGPVIPLGLAIPTALYVVDNPGLLPVDDPNCASFFTVFACTGLGLALMAPCSALGATLAAFLAASSQGFAWRPLLGGVPGVLCAVLAPLACLCFPIPGGSILTLIGLALGIFGGPLSVAGATLFDAQLIERTGALLFDNDDDDEHDDRDDEKDAAREDQMHY